MIHFVLHDARDTVAVVVVEGVKAGAGLTGWVMDDDRTVELAARQDIPIGHKIALKDMAVGDTVVKSNSVKVRMFLTKLPNGQQNYAFKVNPNAEQASQCRE